MTNSEPTTTAPTRTPAPPLQVVWLCVYWLALLPAAYPEFFSIANGVPAYSVVVIAVAGIATIIGATFATRLLAKRVATHWFVKGTTTARVIAVAWLLVGTALNLGPVLSVLLSIDLTGDALTAGAVGTIGTVSLIAILGPGYGEYRDALASLSSHAA